MTWRSTLPAAAALVLGLGTLFGIWLLAQPLEFLVIAISIAEGLAPPVEWLSRWMKRWMAILLVFVVLIVAIGGIGWIVVPALFSQGQEFVNRAPELISKVSALVTRWDRASGGQVASLLSGWFQSLARYLVRLPLAVFSALLNLLLIGFLSLYWLIGAPALQQFVLTLLPAQRQDKAAEVLSATGQAMGGYVRGAAINAVIMGALAWLGLWLIGVNYAIVLGVLTMLGEPIPTIGPIIVAVPIVLVALLQSPTKALYALILYTVLEQVEGQILTPNIMGRQTDIPQTLVIFAVVAGGALGGLLGVLTSIPLAAAVHVLVLQVVVPVVRRWTGAEARDDTQGHTGAA
ncbi:MAG: AI-2E family transporter [Gemmatimonadaceae bacterium]